MEQLQRGFPVATAPSLNNPYQETKSNSKTNTPASEAKCPLPAEEGWVMEKKGKEKEFGFKAWVGT